MGRDRASDAGQGPSASGPSTDRPVVVSRLVLRFVATGVVSLVVVAVVTGLVSRRIGTEEAILDARRYTEFAATATVEPVLTDGVPTGDPDGLAAVDAAVTALIDRGPVVRVKLWDGDGTVVYSDEPRLVGQTFALDHDALAAFAGRDARAEVSDLSKPENRYETGADRMLEVYLPVTTPGGTPLLFEAYFGYEGVSEQGRRVWLDFAPVSLLGLLGLWLILVPTATALARRLRRVQRQREDLLRQVIDSTDAERRRIAGDLHDGVVQELSGVAFTLAAIARSRADRPAGDHVEVRQAAERIRDAVRSLRSLLVDIYPPSLAEEGLEPALSDLVARLEPRGLTTSLTVEAPVTHLDADTTQLIYRAAQEGLRNVVAHAGAHRVDVRVTGDAGRTTLVITDDGRGMSGHAGSPGTGHLGLTALEGLARTKGGDLTVESTSGAGTRLRLEVPTP